ncbi:MAG: FHA domain-containing protein [Pyrinomonadaceae bacterium]
MTDLWLNYVDEFDRDQRVQVDHDSFSIGRHSDNDICVQNSNLSRDHAQIAREGSAFFISDLGSSNGTQLNGSRLTQPQLLSDGDKIDLGGGLEITVELSEKVSDAIDKTSEAAASCENVPFANTSAPPMPHQGLGIPSIVFYIAPIFAVSILILAVGIMYLFSPTTKANKEPATERSNEIESDSTEQNANDEPDTHKPKLSPEGSKDPLNLGDAATPAQLPKIPSEIERVEDNAKSFLRGIAQNDQTAFLTTEQATLVSKKIKEMSLKKALSENLTSAAKSAGQIRALAQTKNLSPQFVAAAAISRLDGQSGDVLQTAEEMIEVLDKLGTSIGNERSDDALLMIAAYRQGEAGEFLKMRNMLQALANQFPESSRSIRSIWFLRENGKITEAEFDSAVRFLAVGTIAQNPKVFNVKAEAQKF